MITIQAVVEGDGDVQAFPVLLRRILHQLAPHQDFALPRAVKAKLSQILHGQWRHLELACAMGRASPCQPAAILVLLDTDGQICPAQRGPELLRQVRQRAGALPCGLVLAHCEFETWLLAAADSLRGLRRLPPDISAPEQPETIRDAKAWLSRHMPPGRRYRETIDQPALAARFDLELARIHSPSFDKLWRTVEGLLRRLDATGAIMKTR